LSHNARNQIKRGFKKCNVKKINTDWLSENGYECYSSAFKKYKNINPLNKKLFQEDIRNKGKYSYFEFWGVFAKKKLAGYAECLVIDDIISTSVIKYNPDYLKYYPAYALTYAMLDYYLNQKKYDLVTNGTRSIAHDTEMQKFLEKFGFKKEFCKLNIVYSPIFGISVKIAYLLRALINIIYKLIPINFLHKITVILRQEKIRRSFIKK